MTAAAHARVAMALVASATVAASCGYRPLYSGTPPSARLSVVADAPRMARPELVTAALAGARARLARAHVLGAGGAYPRMVVAITRIDERSIGIAVRAGTDGDEPAARGSSVAVMGHAWVVEAPGKAPTRETGAMRWSEPHARGRSAEADALADDEALRRAARALGDALAARVLGEPAVGMAPH